MCMCTYKRAHLEKTLSSIYNLKLGSDLELEVIVVDNDAALSGKPFCQPYLDKFPGRFKYISETRKNISAARNAGLNEAKGDWVAFIDDDEVADEDWLVELLKCASTYQAHAVFGQVITIYPSSTPHWIIKGKLFDEIQKNTGTKVSSGASNCTLLNRNFIEKHQIRFNLDYGTTGGEDAEFFNRVHSKGGILVTCKEAIVREEVEENRLNGTYLKKKATRIGQCFSKYRMQNASFLQKLSLILRSSLKLILSSMLILLNLPRGKSKYYPHILNYCDAYGKIHYFFSSSQIELYK